jgi:hypothetical protein
LPRTRLILVSRCSPLPEARDAVPLLMHSADKSPEGREAVQLAAEVGCRLPSN